jgi:guanine deaminase
MTVVGPAEATHGNAPVATRRDSEHMRVALAAARRAGLAGEPPIGACLVRDDVVVGAASNCVITELDITAHAEIVLIREACRKQRTLDLSGSTLYSTVEPCPMCLAASHYARVDRIVYGASLADLHALTGSEMIGGASEGSSSRLEGDCLRDESLALLRGWAGRARA